MSWVRIYVHLVFSTKYRESFLQKDIRKQVFQHIKQNAEKKDIYLDSVNGCSDHAHCLISLNNEMSMAETAQLIKGESSHTGSMKTNLQNENLGGRMIIG